MVNGYPLYHFRLVLWLFNHYIPKPNELFNRRMEKISYR